MFKFLLALSLLSGTALFSKTLSFEYKGILVKHQDNNGTVRNILVKRKKPKVCQNLNISNTTIWSESYAHKDIPDACKTTYVQTVGKLLPIQLDADIETYGVLEVLIFLRQMQKDNSMVLIDSRKKSWFNYRTIPGAINIPFHHIKEHEDYEFEFDDILKTLDIRKYERRPLDFRYSKTIVIFCNGPWCTQSVMMINALVKLGYDRDNIKWYRGGMQSWLISGMTSTRDTTSK